MAAICGRCHGPVAADAKWCPHCNASFGGTETLDGSTFARFSAEGKRRIARQRRRRATAFIKSLFVFDYNDNPLLIKFATIMHFILLPIKILCVIVCYVLYERFGIRRMANSTYFLDRYSHREKSFSDILRNAFEGVGVIKVLYIAICYLVYRLFRLSEIDGFHYRALWTFSSSVHAAFEHRFGLRITYRITYIMIYLLPSLLLFALAMQSKLFRDFMHLLFASGLALIDNVMTLIPVIMIVLDVVYRISRILLIISLYLWSMYLIDGLKSVDGHFRTGVLRGHATRMRRLIELCKDWVYGPYVVMVSSTVICIILSYVQGLSANAIINCVNELAYGVARVVLLLAVVMCWPETPRYWRGFLHHARWEGLFTGYVKEMASMIVTIIFIITSIIADIDVSQPHFP